MSYSCALRTFCGELKSILMFRFVGSLIVLISLLEKTIIGFLRIENQVIRKKTNFKKNVKKNVDLV